LDKNSESLKVIQHARNEAHRFGIAFHRNKRSMNFIVSGLEQINGFGEKTIQKLFSKFGSIDNIKSADIETIKMEIGASRANLLFEFFNSKKSLEN